MRQSAFAGMAFGVLTIVTGCESLPADLGGVLGTIGSEAPLTSAEIDAGLRQALELGTNSVTSRLGQDGGFFNDTNIRIPLPGRLATLQAELGKVGLSGPLDDVQTRMNASASAAMPEARRLVVNAIQSMTLEDALGILRGGDTAATDFLRGRTEDSLRSAFSPFVNQALAESGTFQALDSIGDRYALGAVTSDVRSDLTSHAVNLGLDGLFFYVAAEEKKIREEPVARTTELLRRVFGSI
ncbi:MAG: DUF4197 domain-containing protein [Pseudomonadota bacterium]